MPPVDNKSRNSGRKKTPQCGAFPVLDPSQVDSDASRYRVSILSSWRCSDLLEASACFRDVRRLRSLLTLNYFEFDLIALSERLETRSTDRADMDKDVRTTFA